MQVVIELVKRIYFSMETLKDHNQEGKKRNVPSF